MINDPSAVPRLLGAIRHCRTRADVLVRTHYLLSRAELVAAGASEVVVEEVESGVELLALTLRRMGSTFA